jgi:hypothetical protein
MLVQGQPGMTFVAMQVNGAAMRCSPGPLTVKHVIVVAAEDNVANVVIGIGPATADAQGLHWKRLRPGDDYEYGGQATIDLQNLWINNNASTGHVGDGIMIIKLGFD